MTKTPLVSVVIAAYNSDRYLAETLTSAIRQTWTSREIIVVDDGSTDRTADIAAGFPEVRLFRRPHLGLAGARNFGISEARGDYIALLDADDLWDPDKLRIQVDIAGRHPESGAIICDAIGFDGDKIVKDHVMGPVAAEALTASPDGIVTRDFYQDFLAGREWGGVPAQLMFPRKVIDRVGPFADNILQDTDYQMRVAQHYPLTFHGPALARYRMHGTGLIGSGLRRRDTLLWGTLAMFAEHQSRCTGTDLTVVRGRIRRTAKVIAKNAFEECDQIGRPAAARLILRTLGYRPWSLKAVLYLLGLLAPAPAKKVGGWLRKRMRQT